MLHHTVGRGRIPKRMMVPPQSQGTRRGSLGQTPGTVKRGGEWEGNFNKTKEEGKELGTRTLT